MTITRSAGLYTGYGAYFCGNGYEGSTRELDDTVKRGAELLGTTFNRDIEIRFNSDQQSGGAWLKNSLKGFAGNCQVGINAGLRAIRPEGMSNEDYYKTWRTLPKELYIATYVAKPALKNPNLADSGNENSRYCYMIHKSVTEALAWLAANVDREKIYD